MGLLDNLGGMLGGADAQQILGKFTGGSADFSHGGTDDRRHFDNMLGQASDDDLHGAFSHAAQNVDPQAYREHVTPGAGGTDPLGGLGGGALGSIAGVLLSNLGGGSGGGGGGLGALASKIPGLSHTDPNRMNSHEVAALADYTRQHHPDAFGRAAAQVGRQDPNLLQQLLGNKAMMTAAASLASKFLGSRGK